MDGMDTKVYEDLPDLRQLYPDISNQYATLASLKEENPKMKGKGKGKGKLNLDPMDVLLKQLPLSFTREQIDRLSASFCPLCPSRANCNSLAERLFDVDKLEIIPLYARMVATLSKCMPAFSDALFSGLLDEILKVLPKKGKNKIERKLVVVSFIGELCLFGVASPIKVLQILQACLLDTENLLVAKLLVKICGSILLQNAETTQMMKSIIPQIEGLERNMVENKQRQLVVEAEEEREFERKNQLVRVEQEMRKEQEREERERVEEEKRLEKNRIILLKEEEKKKEKDRLKKLNEERKLKKILKEKDKERERRAKEERDAKLIEERKAKEERDAEVKLIEERKAKEREEKAKRDQLVADAIERRALILKVHNAAQELDRLKEEVWKREDSIGHVGLMPEERRKEEMEEEARLDEAINGHKERIGNLRRLLCEVDYLTKKMDDERKREDDMLVEARKVLEKEEEKKNREEEDEANWIVSSV